ncbi:hypothetical protein [Desulfitobacterium metallireducens]|uniref:N-acetyltransferase domain-containing protein n=1 Tax=Desulfitobacterium metallireducens DSM 15288 TaxID=871968 RepID=W0EHJ5_9FIRM|nr:hypothetical protein [Desulfitobacterium metallireducens]AHF08551.1 hypothetical protein DESME_08800 [Desulfitobacterium metallireducens DSM 15288]
MNHIYEVSSAQLDGAVEFLSENWKAVSEMHLVTSVEKERAYWEEVHHNGRIFYYRGEDELMKALLALTRKDAVVTIEMLYIKPEFKNQDIEMTLLSFAERLSLKWSGESIQLMFSGREELDLFFPTFQVMGYACQCPINQKENVLLEKKLN